MVRAVENAELLSLATGAFDRKSINAFDARVEAVRLLFPHLALVARVVENICDPATEASIQLGHVMLDQALAEPLDNSIV